MLNIHNPPAKQVLVRLSGELAAKLARRVPQRQRNRYIVELLERDLKEREDDERRQLIEAAERMNRLEAEDPEFAREGAEWANAVLTSDTEDDDFDRELFEREFAAAQASRAATR